MRSGPERADLIERDTLFDFVQPAVPAIYRLSERRRGCQGGGELHLHLSLNEADTRSTQHGMDGRGGLRLDLGGCPGRFCDSSSRR